MFYEKLCEQIDKAGWSQNYFSQKFDINRGTLHRYESGGLIPLEKFKLIMEQLPMPATERKRLSDLYFSELFGSEKYKRITHLEQNLKDLDLYFKRKELKINSDIDFTGSNYITLTSVDDALAATLYILDYTKSGKIITNYPYSFKELDDLLFMKLTPSSDFNIFHLVTFNKEKLNKTYYDNYLKSVRWLSYQINPFTCYDYEHGNGISLFSYFFSINDFVLLFSAGGKGLFAKDANLCDFIRESFDEVKKKSTPMAIFPKDMIEFKDACGSALEQRIRLCISRYPSLAIMADEKLINSVIREEVPEIKLYAKMAQKHYKDIAASQEELILSSEGIKEFVKTGKCKEFPEVLIKDVPIRQRLRYLKLLQRNSRKGLLSFIDNAVYSFNGKILLYFYEHAVIFAGKFENVEKQEQYLGQFVVRIFDTQVMQDFYDFANYLKSNTFFYSRKMTESFLDSQIALLQEKISPESK